MVYLLSALIQLLMMIIQITEPFVLSGSHQNLLFATDRACMVQYCVYTLEFCIHKCIVYLLHNRAITINCLPLFGQQLEQNDTAHTAAC